MGDLEFVWPDWPAPKHVRALTTTRVGGASDGAYASFNLGDHVGDSAACVASNRERLREALSIPESSWLKQVHGTDVVEAEFGVTGAIADGSYTEMVGTVCAVLTADCLPVLLTDKQGTKVAALHAGWRGLANGVLEAGVLSMRLPSEDLLAWLGPAIGPEVYEVGDDVRAAFVEQDPEAAAAFTPKNDRWLADMYALARLRLNGIGVTSIYGGGYCTFRERNRFFSYRRDGVTGRMASLIWLE